MGSSEFDVGPNGFPSEYRHTEMYRNYEGMRTRIVTGTRDFIRWYHRRMNAVWDFVRPHHEHEEFEFDHSTPGMAKTLRFHMNAFARPLPPPRLWHHIDVYPVFDVWCYAVETDRTRPGFTAIENVSPTGFRSSVREWLPGGRLMPFVNVRVATSGVYEAGRVYRVSDVNLRTGAGGQSRLRADGKGRLHLTLGWRSARSGHRAGGRSAVVGGGVAGGGRAVDRQWTQCPAPAFHREQGIGRSSPTPMCASSRPR